MSFLGRCERLEDIYICGKFKEEGIHCSKEALQESKELHDQFSIIMKEMKTFDEKHWKISFVNVRSLEAHHQDVQKSFRIMNSDMFGLGETWLEQCDLKEFQGFDGYFANSGRGKGVCGFSKIHHFPPKTFSCKQYSLIQIQTSGFDIIFVYLSKGFNETMVEDTLKSWIDNTKPTAVMGDFNFDYLVCHKHKMKLFLEDIMHFYQKIDWPTHESGSLLDQVYINKKMLELNIETQTYACYFTDHDVISLYIPKTHKE